MITGGPVPGCIHARLRLQIVRTFIARRTDRSSIVALLCFAFGVVLLGPRLTPCSTFYENFEVCLRTRGGPCLYRSAAAVGDGGCGARLGLFNVFLFAAISGGTAETGPAEYDPGKPFLCAPPLRSLPRRAAI